MKVRISIWPVVLLAILVYGCKQPTDPSFSPDGRTLVFEKGGGLFLRSAHGDRKIANEVEGDVAWSADGRKFAFGGPQKGARRPNNQVVTVGSTTVYDVASGRSTTMPNFIGPYGWEGNSLVAVEPDRYTDAAVTIVSVNPGSATFRSLGIAMFSPMELVPLSSGGVLVWRDEPTSWLDLDRTSTVEYLKGGEFRKLGKWRGLLLAARQRQGRLLLYRLRVIPHAHQQGAVLYNWDGNLNLAPSEVGVASFVRSGLRPNDVMLVNAIRGATNSRSLAAVIVVIRARTDSEAHTFAKCIDRYDALRRRDHQYGTLQEQAQMQRISERSDLLQMCMSKAPGGPWKVVETKRTSVESWSGTEFSIGISPDGSKLAVSDGNGMRIHRLR